MMRMKLNEICEVYSGYALKSFNDAEDGLPVVKIGNILTDGTLNLDECQYTTDSVNEKYYSNKGDIYIALSGATTGKIGIMDADERYVVNQRVGIVRKKSDDVPQEYIKYFLLRQTDRILQEAAGCAQPNISPKQIAEYSVPEITKEKMFEVCGVLDKTKRIIDMRKAELTALDDLIKARFVELFGNPITNDRGWEVAELNTVCDGIGDGLHGTPEYDEDGEYPFINGNNLMDGVIKVTPATKMVNEDTYKKHFIELTDNAILLSINGTLGKLAFYNGEEVMLGKSACYCNLKPEINREFVYGVMKTDAFAGFLESNATASTIKNVGLKAIRGFKLILPPEELQFQFIEFANQVDKSKVAVQKALDETQLLFDSLMQEYFG